MIVIEISNGLVIAIHSTEKKEIDVRMVDWDILEVTDYQDGLLTLPVEKKTEEEIENLFDAIKRKSDDDNSGLE